MSSIAYQRTYYDQYLRASRGFAPLAERAPVVAHVRACLAAGMSIQAIATAAGVSYETVWRLDRRDGVRITQAISTAILGVTPMPVITRHGLIRRLQALTCIGYTAADVARVTGLDLSTIKRWRQGLLEEPGPAAETIVAAYEGMSMKPPTPVTRYERMAVTRAMGTGRRNGWAPPLGWEEGEIDDPYAVPDMGAPVRGFDLDEWVYLVQTGEDPNRAAVRCGVQITAVERAAQRQGRRDVASLAAGARIREEKRAAA